MIGFYAPTGHDVGDILGPDGISLQLVSAIRHHFLQLEDIEVILRSIIRVEGEYLFVGLDAFSEIDAPEAACVEIGKQNDTIRKYKHFLHKNLHMDTV